MIIRLKLDRDELNIIQSLFERIKPNTIESKLLGAAMMILIHEKDMKLETFAAAIQAICEKFNQFGLPKTRDLTSLMRHFRDLESREAD